MENLIDVDTKKWKRDLIASCFNHFEASEITKVQLLDSQRRESFGIGRKMEFTL
jgi:hypothetical protein